MLGAWFKGITVAMSYGNEVEEEKGTKVWWCQWIEYLKGTFSKNCWVGVIRLWKTNNGGRGSNMLKITYGHGSG